MGATQALTTGLREQPRDCPSRTIHSPPEARWPMHYQALATDYDGTLATDGRVDEAVLAALQALRASGRRLILISGREHEICCGFSPPCTYSTGWFWRMAVC